MAVSIKEALEIIDKNIYSNIAIDTINIEDSLGFIVAKDIIAKVDLPKFDNSAMDGYAINSSILGESVTPQKEVIYAGTKMLPELENGSAIKIMTGAPVPKNADTIVPIEMIKFIGNKIKLPFNFKKGANIRLKGEELKNGTICIKKNEEINSYTIALLASQGIDKIEVYKKPIVSIIGSGSELKSYHEKNIGEFDIYNSNTPMLKAQIKRLNCEVVNITTSGDDKIALKNSILNSLNSNLIVTTGGASVGEKDLIKEVLLELGMKYLFEKIDIKPGKPTSLGILKNTYILILPGNPTAAMINFELFGKLIINKLKNSIKPYHFIVKTKILEELRLKSGKYSVILGYFNGEHFKPIPNQSPNFILPLKDINSFLITKPDIKKIDKYENINIIMLDETSKEFNIENIFVL